MIQPIRRIGNSNGILIPKAMLRACGISEQVEIEMRDNTIVLRPVETDPRAGWEAAFQQAKLSGAEPEPDLFEASGNDFDIDEWTWEANEPAS